MARFLRLVMVSVVTAFAVWCVLSLRSDVAQISFLPLWQSWDLFLLAMTLTFLNYALRIVRWRWYLAKLGHRVPVGFSILTYVAGFAFTLSPGKLGELFRARYYTARDVPLPHVLAAFWVERLLDLVALLVLSLLILSELTHYQSLMLVTGGAIVVLIAFIISIPAQRLVRFFDSLPRVSIVPMGTVYRALNLFVSARALLRPEILTLGLLIAVAAWCAEGLGLGVISLIFSSAHRDASVAVGIYAVAVLVGALSFLPGGLGSTETVMTALLANLGHSFASAMLTTLTCRFTTLWLGVCLGWLAVFLLRRTPVPEKDSTQMELRKWPSEP